MANEAAGPRWLDVAPERIEGWLAAFAERHGGLACEPEPGAGGEAVTFRGQDGAVAECHPPFPPAAAPDPGDPGWWPAALAAHAGADRTVGVILVRLGGYACGVFTGAPPRLAASKVGSRLVHGRSAAGGQSQRRFARRREKQASEALSAAANCAAGVLTPYPGRLDAVVLGGDRRAVTPLGEDPRLAPFLALAVTRFLTVPDPRRVVLEATPRQWRAVQVRLLQPVD